jgi:hypothetical protein
MHIVPVLLNLKRAHCNISLLFSNMLSTDTIKVAPQPQTKPIIILF